MKSQLIGLWWNYTTGGRLNGFGQNGGIVLGRIYVRKVKTFGTAGRAHMVEEAEEYDDRKAVRCGSSGLFPHPTSLVYSRAVAGIHLTIHLPQDCHGLAFSGWCVVFIDFQLYVVVGLSCLYRRFPLTRLIYQVRPGSRIPIRSFLGQRFAPFRYMIVRSPSRLCSNNRHMNRTRGGADERSQLIKDSVSG